MTDEELIREIHQLPLDKKKAVLEAIVRSVKDEEPEWQVSELQDQLIKSDTDIYDYLTLAQAQQIAGMWTKEKEQQSAEKPQASGNEAQMSIDERLATVQRLFGIFKRDGETPTDDELKEEYANYLAEKYS